MPRWPQRAAERVQPQGGMKKTLKRLYSRWEKAAERSGLGINCELAKALICLVYIPGLTGDFDYIRF